MPELASHPRDPLHGITLEIIINQLVQRHGWSEMGRRIPVRCFQFNPSVKSALTFLRKTPWARQKVEAWFIAEFLEPGTSPPPTSRPPRANGAIPSQSGATSQVQGRKYHEG